MIRGTQLAWTVSQALGPAPRTGVVFDCGWKTAKTGSGDQKRTAREREGLAASVLLKEITCGFKVILESWEGCPNSAL